MRALVRLLLLAALAVWAWRALVASRRPPERATAIYGDGSSIVFEPGSPAFERLAAIARDALRA